jgi:hypothetical protein
MTCKECIHYHVCDKQKIANYTISKSVCKHFHEQPNNDSECPTCHGTGYIGTINWLTKGMTAEELAKEKAEAIAEYEQQIKEDYARTIFEDIEKIKYTKFDWSDAVDWDDIAELRNK